MNRRSHYLLIHTFVFTLALLAITAGAAAQTSQPAPPTTPLTQARPAAIKQILLAFHSQNAVLRTNAIEAMQPIPDRARPMVNMALHDKNPAVRFAALVTVGKLKLISLADQAAYMVNDADPSVRAAAIYAAACCGRKVDVSKLAHLFAMPNPTVRGNVAMLLGDMGNPSAVKMMTALAHVPMPLAGADRQAVVHLEVAQAMVKLGDDDALDALRAGAYSPYDEVRILAVQMLGRLHDHRMISGFEQMTQQNPIQLALAAATALARMDDHVGEQAALKGARSPSAAVRAQAAFALGALRTGPAIHALVALLNDKKPQVRLSAAAAILQAQSSAALSG